MAPGKRQQICAAFSERRMTCEGWRNAADVWVSEFPAPSLWVPEFTPEQEMYMPYFTTKDTDHTGAKDPSDMAHLVAQLEEWEFKDDRGLPLCRRVLAAALRKASFDVMEAGMAIGVALGETPATTTPGQEEYLDFLYWWTCEATKAIDMPCMGHYVKGLKSLGLKDDQGRPLCRDVIVMAIRCKRYDTRLAAEELFAATDKLVHSRPPVPAEERENAIEDMESEITRACIEDDSRRWRRSKRRRVPEF
jgi:hypothetical protein